jgi:hypothetical protein
MWDEFEHTLPPSDPDVTNEEPEVTLGKKDAASLAAERCPARGGGLVADATRPHLRQLAGRTGSRSRR